MRLRAALLAAAIAPLVSGIFVDEAYQTDFHYSLLGIPQESNTFFHRPVQSSKASLLYTLSENGYAGAVNPKDGSILWRHKLGDVGSNSSASFLRAAEGQDTVVGARGSIVTAWSAADGRFVWNRKFEGADVVGLGSVRSSSDAAAVASNGVVVAVHGQSAAVYKLSGDTGAVEWKYEDSSSDVPYRVETSATHAYFVSLHKAMLKGFKLRITSLDLKTGQKTEQQTLNSDGDIATTEQILFVGSASGIPIVVWTDVSRQVVKVNLLGTKDVQSLDVLDIRKGSPKTLDPLTIEVHALDRNIPTTNFLISYHTPTNAWAEIIQIDTKKGNKISKAHKLLSTKGHTIWSASAVGDKLYFVAITGEEVVVQSSDSTKVLQRWYFKTLDVPGLVDKPFPVFATSEVVLRGQDTHAVRSAVLMSSGDWTLIRNDKIGWTRPEQLANVVKAAWAEISESESIQREKAKEVESSPLVALSHRIFRHVGDLQAFQQWLPGSPRYLLDALTGNDSRDKLATNDAFGFNKIVVVATRNGRFIALDAGNHGRVVWNIEGSIPSDVPTPWTASTFRTGITDLLNKAQFPDGGNGSPIWSLKTDLRNPRLNVLGETDASLDKLQGSTVVKYALIGGKVHGYLGNDKKPLWDFSPAKGQRILSVTTPFYGEPIASIGKALGDRSVLYKYLNPNAILVMSVDDQKQVAVATLVDGVSGNVLYNTRQDNVDTSRPIACAVSENWFAFSYTMDAPDDSVSKGYQLVMSELYESSIPNDRGAFGSLANYSTTLATAPASEPHVISQSFHIPEEISHMAVTQTGQGITSRELLVSLAGTNSIVGIPHYMIDPRRPVGKDPTREQMEEQLFRYSPMIDFDPKWYLNHQEEVFGVEHIVSTAASLESTSLIFAYGHDLFGTRVTPSFAYDMLGNTFNKFQLVLTVLALLGGVFFVAPLIQRKQTNTLWQS